MKLSGLPRRSCEKLWCFWEVDFLFENPGRCKHRWHLNTFDSSLIFTFLTTEILENWRLRLNTVIANNGGAACPQLATEKFACQICLNGCNTEFDASLCLELQTLSDQPPLLSLFGTRVIGNSAHVCHWGGKRKRPEGVTLVSLEARGRNHCQLNLVCKREFGIQFRKFPNWCNTTYHRLWFHFVFWAAENALLKVHFNVMGQGDNKIPTLPNNEKCLERYRVRPYRPPSLTKKRKESLFTLPFFHPLFFGGLLNWVVWEICDSVDRNLFWLMAHQAVAMQVGSGCGDQTFGQWPFANPDWWRLRILFCPVFDECFNILDTFDSFPRSLQCQFQRPDGVFANLLDQALARARFSPLLVYGKASGELRSRPVSVKQLFLLHLTIGKSYPQWRLPCRQLCHVTRQLHSSLEAADLQRLAFFFLLDARVEVM